MPLVVLHIHRHIVVFQVIVKRNENQDMWVQLSGEDLTIDPEYFTMLHDRNEHKINETNKEVAFKVEWQRVALAKLN